MTTDRDADPVHTSAHQSEQWLTVQETVAYCLSKGLNRTQKTVRKWAQRARDPESGTAEVVVKAQDTENGFRWLIERTSLDVKIEQEKQFEQRKDGEAADDGANPSAQVPTGAHTSEPVRIEVQTVSETNTPPHLSAPVGTGAHQDNAQMIEFLMKQIDTKDQQLAVKDRQIESMLERDHETNILIQGLQTSLTGVVRALPGAQPSERQQVSSHVRVDNSPSADQRDAIQ